MILVTAASVALVAFQVLGSRGRGIDPSGPVGALAFGDAGLAGGAAGVAAHSRPVYPHSVVPGGVYSPEEVLEAVAADPAVAAHYSGLRADHVRAERVAGPRRVYVSYRLGDEIYWTRNTVPLQPGERILTDGLLEIRSRCGNGISDRPMGPVSDREPEAFEFDRVLPAVRPALAPPADRPPGEGGAEAPDADDPGAQGSGPGPGGWARPGASATRSGGAPNGPAPVSPAADRGKAFIGPMPFPDSDEASPSGPPSGAVGEGARAVPEPGSLGITGIGLAMYALRRLRRTAARPGSEPGTPLDPA